MNDSPAIDLESDPRFPSGKWTGYFLQPVLPGRHLMELLLTFSQGKLTGEGRDLVGEFVVRGKYFVEDGKCHFTKRYLGKHDVFYQGYNEGKGIWGTWEIPKSKRFPAMKGGFHIWPEGLADPTSTHLYAEAEIPATFDSEEMTRKEEAVPVGV